MNNALVTSIKVDKSGGYNESSVGKLVNGGGSVITYTTANTIDDFDIPFDIKSDKVIKGEFGMEKKHHMQL